MTEDNGPGTPQDEAMQSLIGKQLRTLYDTVLVEPIPDKFVELLMKLDDMETGGETRSGEGGPTQSSSSDDDGADRQ